MTISIHPSLVTLFSRGHLWLHVNPGAKSPPPVLLISAGLLATIKLYSGSEIVRGSAEFRGFSRFFGHPWDQCKSGENSERLWGGTSTTIWLTEMVHLSKFAEFHKEMLGNLSKTVSLWKIMANSLAWVLGPAIAPYMVFQPKSWICVSLPGNGDYELIDISYSLWKNCLSSRACPAILLCERFKSLLQNEKWTIKSAQCQCLTDQQFY